ncbi:hypothetical protein AVEN_176094-1 [Araneus ventricosus]|uniref:Uncharacterized protein n=1 Tax=Araneus ventricosus TaxID=182803 RepID=A0A4Y2SLX1_ARAVE|nr:hypothetical protein AVEN_19565-1 [Araneus ventricosus]GBN88909.1 hypothetical protein AVEN_27560-1 [Araneus ventricosus]GBN88911.1 hypothetical protein AVEN_75954-1 [Araneus ventricosus]GBN88966.1 hypothetical protein AVEN_176094-1 [Araneus ventricosus]
MEDQFRTGQESIEQGMKEGQEEMKNQIKGVHGEIEEVQRKIEGVEDKVQRKIEGVEDKVQRKIEEVRSDVQKKNEEFEDKVQGQISVLEKRISDLKIRPNTIPASPAVMYSRPMVKSLTFGGQTSWTVFMTQFDAVSSTNGWKGDVKASQPVASLRGSAAVVLKSIPPDKLTDLTTIEKALESRFEPSHLIQLYRTELKTRR